MTRLLFASLLAVSLVITGCASSPKKTDNTQAADLENAYRIAPAVPVPATAKRKVVLALTGSKDITESKDWGEFKREWRETFAEHASEAAIAYTFSDAAPKPTGEDGTIITVDVSDYRIVGIGARIFFGVMTGNAFIDAKVRFSSLRDGIAFGEQQYNTSSSAWGGIFAKMTPQQVDSIAYNIFLDLSGAK